MRLTWSIPEPPKRDLLARLGRRWAVTCDGNDLYAKPKYGRFWSREKAQAEVGQRHRAERIWVEMGLHQDTGDRWAVTDLMDGAPDLTTRALDVAETAAGWMAGIGIAAMAVLVIIWFAAVVS